MSIFRLSTMLMKRKELNHSLHDINENKWLSECPSFQALDVKGEIRDSWFGGGANKLLALPSALATTHWAGD